MVSKDTVVVRIYLKDMERVNQWREGKMYTTLLESMSVIIQKGTMDLSSQFVWKDQAGRTIYRCPACATSFYDKGLLKVHITQVELG